MKNKKLTIFLSVLTIATSALIGFLVSEFAYRAYLSLNKNEKNENLNFTIFSNSIWQFSKEFGYTYKPNTISHWAMVHNNDVKRCGSININSSGLVGEELTDGDIQIAVMGDSFSSMVHDGKTWVDLLRAKLSLEANIDINFSNYSRDGYGVLQMVDQAAA